MSGGEDDGLRFDLAVITQTHTFGGWILGAVGQDFVDACIEKNLTTSSADGFVMELTTFGSRLLPIWGRQAERMRAGAPCATNISKMSFTLPRLLLRV